MGTVKQEEQFERIANSLEEITCALERIADLLESCQCEQGKGRALVVVGSVHTD